MKILLFDRDEILQGTLKNVVEAKHTEELNGENILEITTYDTQEIKKDYRIVYKDIYGYWHEFIIKGIEEIREDEGIKKQLFCESSFYETLGDYIDDKRPSGTANSALEVALQPTRWEVGQVDNLGTNKTNFYHISAKEAVQKVAEVWQGEIRTRITISGNKITGRYVDLYAQRGHDLGKRFTYTKDLESITRIIHRDDVITALYGYGKGEEIEDDEGNATGGFGRRIDFAEVNNGIPYVENNDARLIWGRNNPDGSKSHVFGKVEFDDCEDKEELLELTKEKLKELSKPLITYEAKVVDLKAFGVEHEGVELGDAVVVVDKEFEPELRVKARVVKITRDLLEPENNDITLGNFMPSITDTWAEQEKHINNFRGKQGVWDRSNIIDKDGNINTQYLDGVIDVVKNQLLATQSGWYTDDSGNIVLDAKDGSSSMMLSGAGFMIANSKLPNGEWDYRTFGTGDGFVADMIITGVLKGEKVEFDLTGGTLLIGNSASDYQLLWDGSELSIRDGTITGTVIRTSDGGDRLEISGDSFKAYYNNIKRVEYKEDRIEFYDWQGDKAVALSGEVVPYEVDGETGRVEFELPGIRGHSPGGLIDLSTEKGSNYSYFQLYPGGSVSGNRYGGKMTIWLKDYQGDAVIEFSKHLGLTVNTPIKASDFINSSKKKLKSNIRKFNEDAYMLVKSLNLYQYDIDGRKDQLGVMVDEAPPEIVDEREEGISLYSYITLVAKAVQDIQVRLEKLERGD